MSNFKLGKCYEQIRMNCNCLNYTLPLYVHVSEFGVNEGGVAGVIGTAIYFRDGEKPKCEDYVWLQDLNVDSYVEITKNQYRSGIETIENMIQGAIESRFDILDL